MVEQVTKLRVFVASPNDVKAERARLRDVIDELNRGIAADKRLVLELVRWETHVAPDMGRPEQVILNQIGPYDILVGIMWQRFGTPTGVAASGTEEEFNVAYDLWQKHKKPRILFYFNQAGPLPHPGKPAKQFAKVLDFKARLQGLGLTWDYSGPDELEKMVREHLTKVIREWERETGEFPRIALELFEGRVRIVDEDLFQHPALEEEVNEYYAGAQRLTWNIVAAQGVIERDQQAELLKQLVIPTERARMICIVGETCAGKSSLAWQLTYELTCQQDKPILQIVDNEDANIWYRLIDFWALVQQPFYVLVDDVFRDESVLRALKGLDPNLLLTILATSRTNEYRGDEGLPFPVERVDLPEPSPADKNRILNRLGKEWTQMAAEERARVRAANQMLILMAELTTGKGFIRFIRDTLERLKQQDEIVYRAYEYLCYAHQYGISMPASLLERLDDRGRFYNILGKKAAKGIIFADEGLSRNLRLGHPFRAEESARIYGRDPRSVFGEILEAVDAKSWVERRSVAHLLREMAWRVSETHLPDILEQHAEKIESIQCEATISEMVIWRTLYQTLDRNREAAQCVDLALSKEPASSLDCTTLLAFCRERGEEAMALPRFQQWLRRTPEDHGARVAYLGLIERYAPEQVSQVVKETSAWLADHPHDNSVRQKYLGLVERKGTAKQVAQVIEETAAWLADHSQDNSVRHTHLGLVERKGTDEQVAQVIEEAGDWLTSHPQDNFVRYRYLGLVERKGTAKQVAQVIEETAAWLADHLQDFEVRRHYLGLVERKGTAKQVAQVIEETAAWLSNHPEDTNVRANYLSLVERNGTDEQVAQVIEETTAWLSNHPEDTNVLAKYLGLVERKGMDEQVAQVIEETAAWLSNHPEDTNARTRYLGLVECRGTDEQVAQVIEETTAWLSNHPEDTSVRTRYLGLVEREGTDEQVAQVIEDMDTWLAEHLQDVPVRERYLGLVEREGMDEQAAKAIEEMGTWLAKHPKDANVRARYLGLVERRGTDEQVAQVTEEMGTWLAEHPEDINVRRTYLGLVERKGTARQKAATVQQTRQWLASYPRKVGFPELYSYGCLFLYLEEFKEAAKQFRAVLEVHKGHAMARRGLALALNALGEFHQAEQEFKHAIWWARFTQQPLGIFYHDLGLFYLEQRRYTAAQAALERAIEESPEAFANYWHLGRVHMAQGDYRSAAPALQTALDKAPEDLGPPASEEIRTLLEECKKQLELE